MKKPTGEVARASARLRREHQVLLSSIVGTLIPIDGTPVYATGDMLMRWGIDGKAGVYLDVVMDRKRCAWVTSREAVARFVEALAGKQGAAKG